MSEDRGLEHEPPVPSEGGHDATGLPTPVGAAAAALDAVTAWLAPRRQRRVVKVPDFRGLHVSETFLIALQAGVKVEVVRLARHPAPVDYLVVKQDPLPRTRAKRDSRLDLIVRHPEDPTWSGQP